MYFSQLETPTISDARSRSVRVIYSARGGWSVFPRPLSCRASRAVARQSYAGTLDDRRTIEDIDTKEEAMGYLRGVKRRAKEGKSPPSVTNIPDGDFWAPYYALPKHIQDPAHRQYLRMQRDPRSVNLQKRFDSEVGQI